MDGFRPASPLAALGHIDRRDLHRTGQQPGGITPDVAAAPVALAVAIVPGVAKFIVMLSAHAEVFGVGITVVVGSRLVATSCGMSGWIVPADGLVGICCVESGKAAPFVGGPPGVELHTVVDELPSGVIGEMVPVVLPTIDVGMIPSGVDGIVMVDDVMVAVVPAMDVETVPGTVDGTGTGTGVIEGDGRGGNAGGGGAGMFESAKRLRAEISGCWENINGATVIGGSADVVGAAKTGGVVPMVVPAADGKGVVEIAVTVGVPGVICPVGVEQLRTVPGVVGSEASGTGARVVPGVPGCVVAENGPGP